MNKKKYLCIGHSTYDITLPVDEYPEENIKHRLKEYVECGGGPASNAAYVLAKWGMDTALMSIVGDDYYGSLIINEFKKVGLNTKYIEQKKGYKTSTSYIIANKSNGSRTVITTKKDAIRKLKENKSIYADCILIDGEHPETALKVLLENKEAISVLDAGRLTKDTKMLGKMVDYLVCSKDFAEAFSKTKIDPKNEQTLIDCYKTLKAYFKNTVIITLEEEGSFTEIEGKYKKIPTISVTSIDSTGAGDIFHGAFTYFIGNGYKLEEAIRLSSITSAISVTKIGSRFSVPKLSEVLEYDSII